jgi:hypothetical protein
VVCGFGELAAGTTRRPLGKGVAAGLSGREFSAVSVAAAPAATRPPARGPRGATAVAVEGDAPPAEVDPDAPVVSAAAIGTDASAEPIPSATASTPTRPTNLP